MTDATHDPRLRSWLESANVEGHDFPVQNLPYGRFRRAHSDEAWRVGVAIGDRVLDLSQARAAVKWSADVAALLDPLARGDLNALMAESAAARQALRTALSAALARGSERQQSLRGCLVP